MKEKIVLLKVSVFKDSDRELIQEILGLHYLVLLADCDESIEIYNLN